MLGKQKTKYIQSLGQKKFRDEEGLFIAEGPKLVQDLLESVPEAVLEIFATDDWFDNKQIEPFITKATRIQDSDLEKISQLKTPNQVVALIRKFSTVDEPVASNTITLVLDTLQDPGNMGTIIRIADWFGLSQIVASMDSADQYNPKVVQSSMGSISRVRVSYCPLENWILKQKPVRVYAAKKGGRDITSMSKISEGVIIIGNESKGISASLLPVSDEYITIPGKGNAESLNAAVAAGIILSHLV